MNRYYTIDRAAELIGCSRTKMEKLIRDNVVPLAYDVEVIAVGGRPLKLVSSSELKEYANSNGIKYIEE